MTEEEVKQLASVMTDLIVNGELEITPIVIDASELLERDDFLEGLVTTEAGFVDPFGQLKQFFTDMINSAMSWLSESIGASVKGFIDWLWDQISPALNSIAGWIEEATKQLTNLGSALTGFVNAILRFPEWFPNWFETYIAKPIADAIGNIAKKLWDLLPDWLKNAITTIRNALSDPLGTLKNAFSWLAEKLWNLLPGWLKDAITGLQATFNALVSGLKDFLQDIKARLEELAKWIWENLPDPIRMFFEKAEEFLESAFNFLVDLFTNKLPGFVDWIWTSIQKFLEDPIGAIVSLLEDIGEKIWSFLSDVVFPALTSIAQGIIGVISDTISAMASTIVSLVSTIVNVIRPFYESLQNLVNKAFEEGSKLIKTAVEEIGKDIATPWETELGEIGTMIVFLGPVFMTHSLLGMTGDAIGGLAETLEHLEIRGEGEGKGEPVGVGVAGRIMGVIRTKLTALARWLADTFKKKADDIFLGGTMAFMFWNLEFMRYVFRPYWMNFFRTVGADAFAFEFPGVSESIRVLQRYYPTKFAPELFDKIARSLYYRGYPYWWYNYVTGPVKEIYDQLVGAGEEEFIVKVTDRFGVERSFPASPFFDIPSASELATMMVRDIFAGLEDFSKAILMRGYIPDIAYMYYLLHFRYPSPSVLWEFVSRGIAGLIWYLPSDKERKVSEKEAESIGAYAPVSPTELNFDAERLFAGLSTYMKWHDYARFSWIENFTSDNWIIIDTLADIPTKIDIRWMTKWAIFDFMVSKGIKLGSPASDFIKVVEDSPANKKVFMDLTLMCRLLQATGLHPYYVPIVAVAETINALADERTLLRTGLINMYEYGAITYQSLDKLMASLVIATFGVAYFDLEGRKWKSGYINLPVAYLPAERKLLSLRAVFDRYLRIFRDTLGDVERAYTEFIITSEEVSTKVGKVVESINKVFGKATQDIVGEKLELTLDEDFINATLEAWKMARDIYTIRRIRSWVYRILGWVIYRTAYGYVTEEDAKRIAKTLSTIAKLPIMEADAVTRILTEMVGIARREYQREYIPTPLTLATMSEHIPAVRLFANKVFEAKGVPQEWRSIWLQYIDIRPIIDEVRSVVSSVRRLYEYFMINTDMFTKFLEVLRPYGYEDRELKLMTDGSNLDRWYRAYRELVGTPRELVTMAEYSPLARRLALAEVKKRIDALPIEREAKEFLYKLWEDYIRIKPVYDEVEREVTELISDYAKGLLTWEQFETLLEELKDWGIDEWEADAIKFLAMMRRRRYELTGQVQAE